MLRVNTVSEFYEIFIITDLQFMCTDQDVVTHYSLELE